MSILYLRSESQKAIFNLYRPQFVAGGRWANSRPNGCGQEWFDCEVRVVGPREPVGTDFVPLKPVYNLCDRGVFKHLRHAGLAKVRPTQPLYSSEAMLADLAAIKMSMRTLHPSCVATAPEPVQTPSQAVVAGGGDADTYREIRASKTEADRPNGIIVVEGYKRRPVTGLVDFDEPSELGDALVDPDSLEAEELANAEAEQGEDPELASDAEVRELLASAGQSSAVPVA